jgi:hypothetical protein
MLVHSANAADAVISRVAFQRSVRFVPLDFRKFLQECDLPHTFLLRRWCSIFRRRAIGFVRSPDDPEEMMYRSASLVRESSDDFTIVVTFALLGLALSLLAIGRGGPIDAEYMADLLLLF